MAKDHDLTVLSDIDNIIWYSVIVLKIVSPSWSAAESVSTYDPTEVLSVMLE